MGQLTADAIRTIHARRSIRRGFRDDAIDDATLEAILDCGCAAPSSKDDQPWVIHAVRDRAVLGSVAEAMIQDARANDYLPVDPATGQPRASHASSVHESADVLRNVPLGLFMESSGSFSGGRSHLGQHEAAHIREALVGYGFEVFGVAAAVQNMWLAAQSLGLVGVFLGDVVIAESAVHATLSLRGDLVGVLALGRSTARPEAPRRRLDGRVVIH
jgi:nitroreductase